MTPKGHHHYFFTQMDANVRQMDQGALKVSKQNKQNTNIIHVNMTFLEF